MVLTTEHVIAIGGKAFGQLKKEQESSLDEMNQVCGNTSLTHVPRLYMHVYNIDTYALACFKK